jgi:hypothetical protein
MPAGHRPCGAAQVMRSTQPARRRWQPFSRWRQRHRGRRRRRMRPRCRLPAESRRDEEDQQDCHWGRPVPAARQSHKSETRIYAIAHFARRCKLEIRFSLFSTTRGLALFFSSVLYRLPVRDREVKQLAQQQNPALRRREKPFYPAGSCRGRCAHRVLTNRLRPDTNRLACVSTTPLAASVPPNDDHPIASYPSRHDPLVARRRAGWS